MRRVPDWRRTLPLAQDAPRCGACCKRVRRPCRGPAMANGRCRLHGGASPGAPSGPANGMWRHGRRSAAVVAQRREDLAERRAVRALIAELVERIREVENV